MAEVDVLDITKHDTAAADIGTPPSVGGDKPARKPRLADGGQETLPDMGHFVTLVRKIKYRPLVMQWLALMHPDLMPEIEWEHKVCATYKHTLFATVASLPGATRQRLELAAERILLLSDDYGCAAVKSLLRDDDVTEVAAIQAVNDKFGRALYLYLQRLSSSGELRFEQAEAVRQQNRQWKSEAHASHFRGPKDVALVMGGALEIKLKQAISKIYPQAPLEEMVIEHFVRRDLAHADRANGKDADESAPVWLHTIVVGFNGKEACWDKIIEGVVTAQHDQAVLKITFSYEPSTGALSVFTEDKASRRDLARALRDVVLAGDGEIADMPIREFDVSKFGTADVFDTLTLEPGDGVANVTINQLKVAREFEQHDKDGSVQLSSDLIVRRDRRDQRNVYTVAYEDYGLDDLTQWTLCQVKLVLRIARQKDRRAHNITVQITAPNGLNDNSKTEEERQLVMRLLKRWQVVTEF